MKQFLSLIFLFLFLLITGNNTLNNSNSNSINSFLSKLCFITATSSNHFLELLAHIKSIKLYYPCNQIFIFNLGLNNNEINILNKISNIKIVPFDNHGRPFFPYGSTAFKPPLLLDFMRSYGKFHNYRYVFYGDSSIFIRKVFDLNAFHELLTNGIVAESSHGRTQISLTHPKMYKYFDYDREKDYQDILDGNPLHQIQAGLLLLDCENETMKNKFFEKWVQCANNPDCLTPDGAITAKRLPPVSTHPNFTVANGVAVYQ